MNVYLIQSTDCLDNQLIYVFKKNEVIANGKR